MRSGVSALARTALFEGLAPAELENVAALMRPRSFEARAVICQAGEPGDSLFMVVDGLADCFLPDLDAEDRRPIARLRRGDVFGEMALITGDPRSATVVAGLPTTVLELRQDAFADLAARHPAVLANLNRILTRRVAEADRRAARHVRRGEAVMLVVGASVESVGPELRSATEAASVASVAWIAGSSSLEATLAGLDELLAEHGVVVVTTGLDGQDAKLLLEHVDRAVALIGDRAEAELLGALFGEAGRVEVVLAGEAAAGAAPVVPPVMRVVRRLRDESPGCIDPRDVAWIGRHLSHTKLGLALGAGGAKGYAHVGALQALESAGYTVDYVAGSSIGAIVGSYVALGMSAGEVERTLRAAFTPEAVAEIFTFSMSGKSSGLDAMTHLLRASTGDRSFDELVIPFVAMAVDLGERRPAPLREGPLWQALLAATALAGIFSPYERDGQRLVDGLALVPVPTDSVVEEGADVTLAVNLIGRETLPEWPGEDTPAEPPRKAGSRVLDTLLEVMDLAQLDNSVRHAARADVVITPRFGPSSWRDFHLADRFLAAGRLATEEQLPDLRTLAAPQLAAAFQAPIR